MKICLFSDIHGNGDAMKRMLDAELYQTDLFIFLGDIFGYFYDQKEVISALMSLKNLLAIKGNHDKKYLTGTADEKTIEKYGSSYKLVLSHLQQEYLQQLPDHLDLLIDTRRFGIFHGGPSDYSEQRIYPDTELKDFLTYRQYEFLIMGHTHYRFSKKVDGMTIINPGSLGQPRDGKGFSYCVLDTETGTYLFKTVEIDVRKLLSQVRKVDSGRKVFVYLEKKYGGITL